MRPVEGKEPWEGGTGKRGNGKKETLALLLKLSTFLSLRCGVGRKKGAIERNVKNLDPLLI